MATLNFGTPVGPISAPLTIKTGGLDVLASGTVITANNKSVEFQLAQLRIVFNFSSDGGASRMSSTLGQNSTLELSLVNFNNSIGTGTTLPLEIGNISGRRLWVAFMIYAVSADSSKTVHYTFLLGDPS